MHLPGAYHKHLRNAFNTLDVRTGHREGVAPRTDLHIDNCSYANLVLGSLMMLPDDAFRRLSVRCGLARSPPLTDISAPTVSYVVPECMRTTYKTAYIPSFTVS